MKVKFQFIFLVAGVLCHHASFAETLTTKTTPYGYDRKDFCGSGAKNTIEELDKSSHDRIKEITKLKTQINDLSARKNLISGFLQIRDQFQEAYNSIASDQEIIKKDEATKIDNFKKLLRSSLTLSAISMTARSAPEDAAKNSITDLCKNAKNSQTNLCHYINNEKMITSAMLSPEISNLNKTIENVNLAYSNTADPDAIKSDLGKIYDSIPSPIAPDKVLGDLIANSSTMVKVLSENDKTSILECLKDNQDSCKNLLSNRDNLKNILTSEMNKVQMQFSKNKLNQFFVDYDKAPLTKDEQVSVLVKQKSAEAIAFVEGQPANKEKKLKDLGFTSEDFDKYKEICGDQIEKNITRCREYSKNLISHFESQNADLGEEMKETMKKLDDVVADNGSLEINEKMKQYVAQKYLRTCSNASTNDITSNFSCPCLEKSDLGTNLPGNDSEFGMMNSKLSGIIGRLKMSSTLSAQKGELGPFSKEELKAYSNYCDNTTAREKYKDICNDISSESRSIENQRESKDWEDFNKNYWVEYNPRSKNGYDVYEKKSNSRIFGEGLSQSISKIYPLWFSNYQLGSQIDMMTNQALYQKQLNYMYSYDSPWMNSPYFQGNYFSTSFNTSNPFLNTNGFNFAK